jgi:hypothetical protein
MNRARLSHGCSFNDGCENALEISSTCACVVSNVAPAEMSSGWHRGASNYANEQVHCSRIRGPDSRIIEGTTSRLRKKSSRRRHGAWEIASRRFSSETLSIDSFLPISDHFPDPRSCERSLEESGSRVFQACNQLINSMDRRNVGFLHARLFFLDPSPDPVKCELARLQTD